jgi:hypothetical protein
MTFLLSRGVPSAIFAALFTGILLGSVACFIRWGRHSPFLRLIIFSAIRLAGAICGIIVAADNFNNSNVIVAEIVLSQVGSFIIYYTLVGFYHSTYAVPF